MAYLSHSLEILGLHACCATEVKAPHSLRDCCLPIAQVFVGLCAKLCWIARSSSCKAKDGGLNVGILLQPPSALLLRMLLPGAHTSGAGSTSPSLAAAKSS